MILHYNLLLKRLPHFISILFVFLLDSCLIDIPETEEYTTLDIEDIYSQLTNIKLSEYQKIKNTTTFPILGWLGINGNFLTEEHFQNAKDAGLSLSYYPYANADSVQKALNLAQKVGLKLIIRCPELESSTSETVKRFMNHPALMGYFIKDEPSISEIPKLKKYIETIKSIDDQHLCYVNFFPNHVPYSNLGTDDYIHYIEHSVNELSLDIISFDNYPIVSRIIRPSWYQNLREIREISNNINKPFWAFALTTAHSYYSVPSIEDLRLQVYSNLAYGAKGLQYYTYWTIVSTISGDIYTTGPIEKDGSKTVVYDRIKTINEEVNALADIFLSSKVVHVSHYGEAPYGATKYTHPPTFVAELKIRGGDALVSEMKSETNTFLLIQNTNLNKEIGIKIETNESSKIILKNGRIVPSSLINKEFKLNPGDIVIYMD